MPEIQIAVINKVPKIIGDIRCIVAKNSDYTIRFTFDEMWEDGEKNVYFVRENGFAFPAAETADDTVTIPTQNDPSMHSMLFIGVQQGNVKTSRPVEIRIASAITDMIDDEAVQPEPSMWEDVVARLEKLEKNGGGGGVAFETGFGLSLKGGVLAAEVGAASFHEITNAELQEIINRVKTEG